ncbi:MAG: hypothetical protein HFE61_06015 [Anaerotignum sp.]|jgi:hypothetical protein|nr:hypothetical protein [Anaerotignum sp.]
MTVGGAVSDLTRQGGFCGNFGAVFCQNVPVLEKMSKYIEIGGYSV